ncbi:hypothetical protein D9M68_303500 [compost metagenome]
MRRAGDALAQHRHLVVHALRRRHEEGVGDRGNEVDEGRGIAREHAQSIHEAVHEAAHIGLGVGDRGVARAMIIEPDECGRDDNQHGDDDQAEHRPQRAVPAIACSALSSTGRRVCHCGSLLPYRSTGDDLSVQGWSHVQGKLNAIPIKHVNRRDARPADTRLKKSLGQFTVTGFERMRATVSRSARLQRIGGRLRSIRSMSSSTMSPIFLKALSSAPARWAERRKPGRRRTG